MEQPQPRPFGTEGRRTTHDFLSLYSPAQQDPRPPHAGSLLKTHDFLQPLEQIGKNMAKEEDKVDNIKDIEKPSPTVEHLLPGGIGTYSITYFNQSIPKPDGNSFFIAQACSTNGNDENSNCSSYRGSGFTLWDESTVKKGKTGKENNAGDKPVLREAAVNMEGVPWTTSSERPSISSSNHHHNTTTFSSLSSSQASPAQRSRSFMNMITSAKNVHEEDDNEEEEEFIVKKEPSISHPKGNLSVKVDGKSTDQKPNTPRSKHSATEQRRRSKINDRFQKLREIIPNSDQKRDKASFLLEVIEYIQILQEKVRKYEGSYQGWNQETSKLMPWRNHCTPEDLINQTQSKKIDSCPASMVPAKFDESKTNTSPSFPFNGQNLLESHLTGDSAFREKVCQPELINKAASVPLPLQPSILPFRGVSNTGLPTSSRQIPDLDKTAFRPQSQFWPSGSFTSESAVTNKLKDRELTIEHGTISISSIYSQGLLNTLTQALQTSGIDLSHTSLSVQIDLGKRANGRISSAASAIKDFDVPTSTPVMPRSIVTSTGEDSSQALKRLKISRR